MSGQSRRPITTCDGPHLSITRLVKRCAAASSRRWSLTSQWLATGPQETHTQNPLSSHYLGLVHSRFTIPSTVRATCPVQPAFWESHKHAASSRVSHRTNFPARCIRCKIVRFLATSTDQTYKLISKEHIATSQAPVSCSQKVPLFGCWNALQKFHCSGRTLWKWRRCLRQSLGTGIRIAQSAGGNATTRFA